MPNSTVLRGAQQGPVHRGQPRQGHACFLGNQTSADGSLYEDTNPDTDRGASQKIGLERQFLALIGILRSVVSGEK